MKPNINDVSKLSDLKRLLADKNVTTPAINTIEKALKKGMAFRGMEDLAILNIPTADLSVVSEVVGFGPTTEVVKNIKTVEYQFRLLGDEAFFFGYQLVVTFLNAGGFTIEQAYPIEGATRVIVDYDLNDLMQESRVTLRVHTAQGKRAKIRSFDSGAALTDEVIEVAVSSLGNRTIEVEVDALEHPDNPAVEATYAVKGRVLSTRPDAKMDGYQVVLFAATANLADGRPDFSPVAFARTETNGYFVTGPLLFQPAAGIHAVTAAKALVTRDAFSVELPVRLVASGSLDEGAERTSMLPDRLILMINEAAGAKGTGEGQKDCGCSELNFHEKKVLEEHSYYTVVRTSEPSIIADVLEDDREIDLQDIYGVPGLVPFSVFKKFHAIQSRQLAPAVAHSVALPTGELATTATTSLARAAGTAASVRTAPFNHELLNRLTLEHRANVVIKGNAKPVFKGRTHLDQMNQIDWDEATIYQAASIAHGHLLHFKQEWMPDGYSIGDIVYSLPLAPGQKKQIAVLDWERRESAANSQSVEYEESLNNSLVRDRDINEVISGTLTENIRGSSKATTGGIGFGLGAAVMGVFTGGAFGGLMGISGGKSSSGSTASQSSSRESTANSLQLISDRTTQAASVVRSQRATVVQTVSQGERVQATAESVANYNHCHAITIQYFEVLRHFAVRSRLAGVQECLFIPLQMAEFDLEKCMRWRNSLERHLFRRELRPAFDALARIKNEKESPSENYYDSIGFPRKNFAEQAIVAYTGELFMDFFFYNTKEEKLDAAIKAFYTFFGISLDVFGDRKITDEELAEHVGPRAIEYLLDAFTIETDKGVDLKLDLTLLTTFRQNATLRVSVRQSANTRVDIARDQITAINIKLDLGKLSAEAADNLVQFQNKYMKVRLRSGNLRYRTENMSGALINGRIDNDIFAGNDGAYMPTPLTREELRNPRGEDLNLANNLLHHLNENLEHYHKCLFFDMPPERRFMLLDGIIAPGKALGRSVASVVENRVIGIAGNSLIMPVAPGYQLDPTIDETFDLFSQYYHDEHDPMRISVPTKGIYAEAVMGKCNSCEEKDESRFWRWEESPIPDSPNTQILPLNTDTRRADPGNLQPKDLPNPVVNIQNAPNLPDPTGLSSLLQLLGKGDAFRDLTGLNQNQLNALATFQKTLDTAQAFGKEAAELAKAASANKLIEDAQRSGAVSNEKAKELTEKNINAAIPASREQTMDLATKQLDLINGMEQQGQINASDAQTARKNILDNLLKGVDSGSTSTADLGTLMEKAGATGTSVKKDGEAFAIDGDGGTTKPLIIDVKITPTLRSFGPQGNVTGKTKLSAKPKNAPSGSTLFWHVPATEVGKYTITQSTNGDICEVEISGITPGASRISVILVDSGGNEVASQIHNLAIPQFVTIEEAGTSSPTLFDNVLTSFQLLPRKDDILSAAKGVCDSVLQTANVRLLWRVGPFSDPLPPHLPAANITTVVLQGDPPAAHPTRLGVTNPPVGATVFNERIDMFVGAMANPTTGDMSTDTTALIIDIQSQGMTAVLEPFAVEVIGRVLGSSMSHEIIHSLLGTDISPNGHNNPSIPNDLMNDGSTLSSENLTGFRNTARTTPIDPADFTDLTIAGISRLTPTNQARMDLRFPVPPAFR